MAHVNIGAHFDMVSVKNKHASLKDHVLAKLTKMLTVDLATSVS